MFSSLLLLYCNHSCSCWWCRLS